MTFSNRAGSVGRMRPASSGVRVTIWRPTLHHALLSYLFGAVLLGLVINVVATLLK